MSLDETLESEFFFKHPSLRKTLIQDIDSPILIEENSGNFKLESSYIWVRLYILSANLLTKSYQGPRNLADEFPSFTVWFSFRVRISINIYRVTKLEISAIASMAVNSYCVDVMTWTTDSKSAFGVCTWARRLGVESGSLGEKIKGQVRMVFVAVQSWHLGSMIPPLFLGTLQGTNISPKNGILKMIFLFPRWDMLIPWRVSENSCQLKARIESWRPQCVPCFEPEESCGARFTTASAGHVHQRQRETSSACLALCTLGRSGCFPKDGGGSPDEPTHCLHESSASDT